MAYRFRILVPAIVAAFAATVAAASAQVSPEAGASVVQMASGALSDALQSKHAAQAERDQLASSGPIGTPPPEFTKGEGQTVVGFPKGLTYTFDFSSTYGYGDTGEPRNGLPGGFDASLTQRLEARTNAFVQYYQLQVQVLGVNSGSAPVYNPGASTPINNFPVNLLDEGVSTKVDALVFGLQRLFFVGGSAISGGHPVVFVPAYATVKADVGGGHLDYQTQYNNGEVEHVQQVGYQQYSASLAIPLSLTEKLNVLYVATPEVLVHPNGFNQSNHVQLEQQVLAQYNPNPQTTIFFNPSHAYTYFPTYTYPVSTSNFVYGIVHRFKNPEKRGIVKPFIQAEVITSNPNNPIYNSVGIARLTQIPGQGVLTTSQGSKFTSVQLSVGSGSPPIVVPYP